MFGTFRAKLNAIVAVAALAFSIVIGVSWVNSERVENQLVSIQKRFIPRLELGPQLEAQFEQLKRALQDAVGARDAEALEKTRDRYDSLLQQLGAAREVLDPGNAELLRDAFREYFESAFDISRRMIEGETGEDLVSAMRAMQAKQARAGDLLQKATAFDRGEFARAFEAANVALASSGHVRLLVGIGCLGFVILLSLWLSRGVLQSLAQLSLGLERVGLGDFDQEIPVAGSDELAGVAQRANAMAQNLKRLHTERDHSDWLKNALVGLARELRGELAPEEVGARAVRFLARYLEAPVAVLYYVDAGRVLRLTGEYGLGSAARDLAAATTFRVGEGLLGQACLADEITVIASPPPDYLRVQSGVGAGTPEALALVPILHHGAVTGVLELGLFTAWSEDFAELLLSIRETLAIAMEVARTRASLNEALAESRRQAERLSAQEEELQASNEELQVQQEELRQTNDELSQQAEVLESQRAALHEKNQELDQLSQHLTRHADELKQVSAYKSQFLANMSHELRTPLNSMLLLSNLLAENDGKNLTPKQVEYSRTIHSAGKDLLALIDQVLDLAKVEAGKQQLRVETLPLSRVVDHAQRVFEPLAEDKGLQFHVELGPGLPDSIDTDPQRLQQILNNLLANAIKFTDHGGVTLEIRRPEPSLRGESPDSPLARGVVFAVIDTGVGIAPEHQARVFAPFEQVEAAADRRFGGTGLGLTISRELAELLGGTLELHSVKDQGSTFTCRLPDRAPLEGRAQRAALPSPVLAPQLSSAASPAGPAPEAYLLVVEDDPLFAETVGEVIEHQGLSWQRAADGQAALALCKRQPPSGIILDLKLPDLNGWQIMDQLHADPATANIPVHFVSAADAADRALAMGAIGYLRKPATRQELARVVSALSPRISDSTQRLLIVEPELKSGESLVRELSSERLLVTHVADARQALQALEQERFACMVLDFSLHDIDALEFLAAVREQCGAEAPSIIVYTSRPLSKEEAKQIDTYAEAVVLKEGSSMERLLDEVRLFVRRLKGGLAPKHPRASRAMQPNVQLEGKRVLVVDDDMRTVYALSATLRAKGADVLVADTGKAALVVLTGNVRVDAVLMDIMMPEMDGYETMQRIRQDAQHSRLPIIALTAKAMKGDKDRCLEVGASDYLPKPIDPERLLAKLHALLNTGETATERLARAPRTNGA